MIVGWQSSLDGLTVRNVHQLQLIFLLDTDNPRTAPAPHTSHQDTFRNILRASLHRVLSESRSKDNHTGRSSPGGNDANNNVPRNQCLGQVLTKDSVTVSVDAVVYYRVSNATVSVANVENAHHSTRLVAE